MRKEKNISILGPGRWGTFLAWYCAKNDINVQLWGRENSLSFQTLKKKRSNQYLQLPEKVIFSTSLSDTVTGSDIVLIAIAAQGFRGFCSQLTTAGIQDKKVVLCMKGLEAESGKRLSEIIKEECNITQVAVWAGPGHVQEFVKGHPNAMVMSADSHSLSVDLAEIFASRLIRFYHSDDIIGTEIGAAAKNVMGLAAGLLDGLDLGTLKGALMSRGAAEISRLVKAMGGNEMTVYGLSHLGDYEATLFSPFSQNRQYGEALAKGIPYPKLAEGVATTKGLLKLAKDKKLELPITEAVHSILFENKTPKEALTELFLRPGKAEF